MKSFYQNKKILITGAASGIGKRFAEKVSRLADVELILWDLNKEQLDALRDTLPVEGQKKLHTTGIDITDREHLFLESEHLKKENLLPDVIINCAGVVTGSYFHRHSMQEISDTININVLGSMWVVQLFLSDMVDRGSGHIVNMASASGYIGNPRMSVYASSKWAVLGWSESLRLEMQQLKTGISVTTVIPSYVDTGMFKGVKAPALTPILTTEQIVDKMLRGIASGKTEIRAPFIVNLTPFLKAVLPKKVFDWLAGRVFGVYHSMDTFEGRK
ncbi:SDR family NAD(P)-dependent oxidoreductase [Rhodohalobacter mucosus]|uniref:Short-chain dehydrogenase n=1 Tax=Rhodohalobacter mucosus TaxID=2079485 RepID=A0A316TZW5_9BACT|nr:SDR family NAD(P)-dependent oxidoreductase [Rhodohalobacter mucosus]PWN05796.1 short-chain dehydrogenase [Rhodohalobacter mucosus]